MDTIFNLVKEKRAVRVRDIAQRLGVKIFNIISMLKTPSEKGMIDYKKYEYSDNQRTNALSE